MRNWLENNFRLVVEFDEEKGREVDMIEWELNDGRKRSASIEFIVSNFGDSPPEGLEEMLGRCPTEGWKENIIRWHELGILN